MKNKTITKILFLLFPIFGIGQTGVYHQFVSSNWMLGADVLFENNKGHLGMGFSGALDKMTAAGEWQAGKAQEYEKEYITGQERERWFSCYAIVSKGYINSIQIAFNAGFGMFDVKDEFNDNGRMYNKNKFVDYVPLVGASAQYAVTNDIGLMVGVDTFNGAKVGVSIIFQ
jgi:hypothetical protein